MAQDRRQEAEKVDKTEKRWKINSCSTWTVVSRSIIRANNLDAYTSFGTRGSPSGASNRQSRRSEVLEPSVRVFRREARDDSARRRDTYFKEEKNLR